jgi:N-acyl homoserine lactone hydrolase
VSKKKGRFSLLNTKIGGKRTMKLYILSSGRMWNEKGFLFHWGTKEDSGKEYAPKAILLSNCQYFIDHEEGKILLDAGIKAEEFAERKGFPMKQGPDGEWFTQKIDENPPAQLAKIGVDIDDIDYVVMSHLMNEHAGWLPAFSGKKARIVVQQKEFEYAQRIASYKRSKGGWECALEQFHSWMYLRHQYDIPGLNYSLVDGDYELVKGVNLIHCPGHTPGYQIMTLTLPSTGLVALSPCEALGNYYGIPINGAGPGIPHSFTWFHGGELKSLKRIRDLIGKEKGQIFCGHDWDQYINLKHVPDFYD